MTKSATHKHFFASNILSTEKFFLLLQPKKGYRLLVIGYRYFTDSQKRLTDGLQMYNIYNL